MSDYHKVSEALQAGTQPELLCATCPWTRTCVEPPSMTAGEVQQQIEDAKTKDEAAMAEAHARGERQMPTATLITALAFAGRDTRGGMCPVFALRLRTSGGRQIADAIRAQMQDWHES